MKIKVMIVDDSLIIRALLTDIIRKDPKQRFEVVASAKDGADALIKLNAQEVDVITMDVQMPNKDGIETLKEIMQRKPTPVVMLSSLTKNGAKETIEALYAGAVDFIEKPGEHTKISKLKEEIYEKLENATKTNKASMRASSQFGELEEKKRKISSDSLTNLIAVGCSTGGPKALHKIAGQLPSNLSAGIVVVQHMPEGQYIASMAKRLNQISSFEVREAKDGDVLKDGLMLIAPAGLHTEIYKRDGKFQVVLNKREPVSGHRPSVDATFASIARIKTNVPIFGVVLTGMGSDGSLGSENLKNEGAVILAESENTAVIYGMPKQVALRGIADYVEDLENIVPKLSDLIGK